MKKSVGEHLSVTMTLKFAKCPVLLLSGIKESVLFEDKGEVMRILGYWLLYHSLYVNELFSLTHIFIF